MKLEPPMFTMLGEIRWTLALCVLGALLSTIALMLCAARTLLKDRIERRRIRRNTDRWWKELNARKAEDQTGKDVRPVAHVNAGGNPALIMERGDEVVIGAPFGLRSIDVEDGARHLTSAQNENEGQQPH
jgi:hypothetical protein